MRGTVPVKVLPPYLPATVQLSRWTSGQGVKMWDIWDIVNVPFWTIALLTSRHTIQITVNLGSGVWRGGGLGQ